LPKESFPHTFDPKIPFQVVWGAPNPNFALRIGGNQKQFWEIFWWGMEDLQGFFHPWKFGKDPTRNGEKLGAQFWGFKLLITPALSPTRKALETVDEKLPYQTHAFSPYTSSQWVSQWHLSPLQTPKPLGLKGAFLLENGVVLGDGYQVKPRRRRCGQNWRHIVG